MIRSVLNKRTLPFVLSALCILAPGALAAEETEANTGAFYIVTPALERAISQPRYFTPESPESKRQRGRSRWRKAWIASVAAFALANAIDVHSSAGKAELNPMLRGDDGRFSTSRATALKGGIGAGFIAFQGWLIHRNPETNYYKRFTFANTAAAGGLSGVAAHNYGVARPAR